MIQGEEFKWTFKFKSNKMEKANKIIKLICILFIITVLVYGLFISFTTSENFRNVFFCYGVVCVLEHIWSIIYRNYKQ